MADAGGRGITFRYEFCACINEIPLNPPFPKGDEEKEKEPETFLGNRLFNIIY